MTLGHEAWSHWTAVEDKEELRLRLEGMRCFSNRPESLLDFVLFFFRTSDPILYQPAAITLGSHWGQKWELHRQLLVYAGQRKVDLSRSVRLNGARSARRLFLLQATAAMAGSKDAPMPDPIFDFLQSLPVSSIDLSIGLLAKDAA